MDLSVRAGVNATSVSCTYADVRRPAVPTHRLYSTEPTKRSQATKYLQAAVRVTTVIQ